MLPDGKNMPCAHLNNLLSGHLQSLIFLRRITIFHLKPIDRGFLKNS